MENLKSRLEQEDPPASYYDLLDLACFTDDRELALAAVRTATKFLHQYQNHKNPSIVRRARSLQLLCATAGNTFSDSDKWRAYNDELKSRLRDKYLTDKPPGDLRRWLKDVCHVAAHRVDEVAAFVDSSGSTAQSAVTALVRDTRVDDLKTSTPLQPPFDIQSYEVLERLGEGGMGVVFKARHRQLEKLFAIKLLRNEKSVDSNAVARFLREMKAIGKLDHPNIVRATDAGQFGDDQFLVMELVEGRNLQQLVGSRGPLPVHEVCDIICQACLGLQHAFERGLVHRDIKPSNLMLSRNGTVKILDMGLAVLNSPGDELRRIDDQSGELTAEGLIVGTIDYMAPEQRNGRHHIDTRADIYSLGCTMFFLLTGQVLFRECGSDLILRLAAHASQPVGPLKQFRSDVPDEIEAIMRRMLAKLPQDRYQTGAEVAAALTAALAHLQNSATVTFAAEPIELQPETPAIRTPAPMSLQRGSPTQPISVAPPVMPPKVATPAVRTGPITPQPVAIAKAPSARIPTANLPSTTRPNSPAERKAPPSLANRAGTDLVMLRPDAKQAEQDSNILLWCLTAAILTITMIVAICLLVIGLKRYRQHSAPSRDISFYSKPIDQDVRMSFQGLGRRFVEVQVPQCHYHRGGRELPVSRCNQHGHVEDSKTVASRFSVELRPSHERRPPEGGTTDREPTRAGVPRRALNCRTRTPLKSNLTA